MSATHPRVKDDHAAVIGLRTTPMGPDASWERPWGAPEQADEVLIALAVSANGDPNAARALAQLENLRGCDVHTSTILGSVDEGIFRSLGIQVTNEPVFATKTLYRKR